VKIIIREGKKLGYWDPFNERQQTNTLPAYGDSFEQEKTEICIICMNEIKTPYTFTCPYCKAIGHHTCFDRWLAKRKTCPLCYKEIIIG